VCCVAACAHVGGAKFVAYVAESSRDLFCAYTRPRGVYIHPWMCTVSFGIGATFYGGCTSLVCTSTAFCTYFGLERGISELFNGSMMLQIRLHCVLACFCVFSRPGVVKWCCSAGK
jgi:hypothetical protein